MEPKRQAASFMQFRFATTQKRERPFSGRGNLHVSIWPLLLCAALACSRAAADASPELVVRAWLDKMEDSQSSPSMARETYDLLSSASKRNLENRAERAGRILGKRLDPRDMLTEGRFGLRFRPKRFATVVTGTRATVEATGSHPSEHALIVCTKEGSGWRIELDLPEVAPLPGVRRD